MLAVSSVKDGKFGKDLDIRSRIVSSHGFVGDFNNIFDQSKKREVAKNLGNFRIFKKLIDDLKLLDIAFQGLRFAWNNKRYKEEGVKETNNRDLVSV